MSNKREIMIFEGAKGNVTLNADFENDTIWATENQVAELFETTRQNVNLHVNNVLAEDELKKEATCKDSLQVRTEGSREVKRKVTLYNLDMILSVGYRIKSSTATKFRKWATSVLKQHLLQGFTINKKRLDELNKVIEILGRSENDTIAGVSDILQIYTAGLNELDKYDHQKLTKPEGNVGIWELTYENARKFVDSMSFSETSDLFGAEREDAFKAVVGQLDQSFGGQELYPTLQEKAAILLYLSVKNHPFLDGNKRIAAALFVYYLNENGALRDKNGALIIANNTLAAMTLMIALSKPEEKDIMCLLVMNMLIEEGETK